MLSRCFLFRFRGKNCHALASLLDGKPRNLAKFYCAEYRSIESCHASHSKLLLVDLTQGCPKSLAQKYLLFGLASTVFLSAKQVLNTCKILNCQLWPSWLLPKRRCEWSRPKVFSSETRLVQPDSDLQFDAQCNSVCQVQLYRGSLCIACSLSPVSLNQIGRLCALWCLCAYLKTILVIVQKLALQYCEALEAH